MRAMLDLVQLLDEVLELRSSTLRVQTLILKSINKLLTCEINNIHFNFQEIPPHPSSYSEESIQEVVTMISDYIFFGPYNWLLCIVMYLLLLVYYELWCVLWYLWCVLCICDVHILRCIVMYIWYICCIVMYIWFMVYINMASDMKLATENQQYIKKNISYLTAAFRGIPLAMLSLFNY